MDFGIPTLIEHNCVEDSAKLARELGFQFVELNMNLPWVLQSLDKEELSRLSSQYSVYFTIHADENLFFCDFNDYVSNAHLRTMLETIAFAKNTGIPLINFHMSQGVYFTLPRKKVFLFEQYEEAYRKKLGIFARYCSEAAEDKVMLCIENTGLSHPFVHRGVDSLLSFPCFRLTWDVGHDYSAGQCDLPFLTERKDHIVHMHLHDAIGKDCHLPLGSGQLKLNACLDLVHPERIVIEVKTIQGLYNSLPWLKSNNLI